MTMVVAKARQIRHVNAIILMAGLMSVADGFQAGSFERRSALPALHWNLQFAVARAFATL